MITAAAEALILSSVIAESIDNIDVISISTDSGEEFRKAYQNKEQVSNISRKYTFYLTEDEANVLITKVSLYGNGATTTLGDGTEMSYQNVNIDKTVPPGGTGNKSFLINWTVEVI